MKLSPYVLVAVVLSIPGPSSAYPVDRDSVAKRQQESAVEFPTVDLDRRGLFSWILNLVDDDSQAAAPATAAAAAPAATTVAAQAVAPVATSSAAPAAATSASSGGFGSFLSGLFGGGSSTTTASTAAAAAPVSSATAAASPAAAAAPASSSSSGGLLGFFSNLFGGSSSSSPTTSTTSAPASSVASSVAASSAQIPAAIASAASIGSGASSASSAGPAASGTYTNLPGFDDNPSSSPTEASYSGSRSANVRAASSAKGISYSPYTKSGSCKTASEVKSDIAELSSYSLIRLYSVDCSGIQNVLAAMSSSQQLFWGVWPIDLSSVQNDLQSAKQQVQTSSRGWSAVHTIAIGNEQVNSGQGTVQQVTSGVQTARSWLKQNAPSYNGYVVTVDTLVAVVANPSLCDVSDYLAVNSHPYWDGGVQPSNSGPWLQNQISNLKKACGNSKSILITETGWPTEGSAYGQCQPSVSNQLAAIKSINSVLADQVFMFTTFNDYWKDGGAYGVEKYWGIYGDPSA
jgi:exo-beta-1,3-glucanase (GH17 family)